MANHDRLNEIFTSAVEIEDAEARDVYLSEQCGSDAELRSQVDALLEIDSQASGLFDPSRVADVFTSATEQPGTTIGDYKLLEQIGEGGMGVVFVAEQLKPVRRKVALKIIKPGMDTKEVIARFEAERQALALMDHPGVAKVFDADTTKSGRSFFAMELVRGRPITEYCDRIKLGNEARLRLFVTVCQAIHHAHQKGIIHRDIKPSNVLVTELDGEPLPKIIDFGVAKAINQRLTEHTIHTRFQHMIGTPMYMSPEQAELSAVDIDTRTDIYSLGILLYELMTGVPPFDQQRLKEATFDEMRNIIRDEEPTKPSTRISTLGESTPGVCLNRQTDAKRLRQYLRGDLDWIVMKAIDKNRSRRYETARELSMDVARFLNQEPVQACPPSALYLLRKFVRRHRTAVVTGVMLMTLLTAGIVGTATGWWNAVVAGQKMQEREREAIKAQGEAAKERDRAMHVVRVLNEMLESADPVSNKADYTVREMLDEFAATLDGRFDDDPQVEASLRHTVGRAYYHLGLFQSAVPHLQRARDLLDRTASREEAVVLTKLAEALNRSKIGGGPETETLLRRAVEVLKQLGNSPKELANAYSILGWAIYHKTGGLDYHMPKAQNESLAVNREGLRLLEPFTDRESQLQKARMCVGLAWELARSGDHRDLIQANTYAERAIEIMRNDPHDVFASMAFRVHGWCQFSLENHAHAEKSSREAVRLEVSRLSTPAHDSLYQLLAAMFQQGRVDKAINLGLEKTDPTHWPDPVPQMCVRSRTIVANALIGVGDYDRAAQILRDNVARSESQFGSADIATLEARYSLIQALVRQRNPNDRDALQKELLAILPTVRQLAATGAEAICSALHFLMGNLESPTDTDVQSAVALNNELLQRPLLDLRRLRNLYSGALIHIHAGNFSAAQQYLLDIIESPISYTWHPGPGDAPFYVLRNAEDVLAEMLVDQENQAGAERVYREAIKRRQSARHPDKYQILFAKQRLAKFLIEHREEHDEALDLLQSARADLESAGECFTWLRKSVDSDLLLLEEGEAEGGS